MKEPVQAPQALQTIPQRVWKTLTETQRQAVLRTFVRICQTLINQNRKEGKHEPGSD